MEDKIKGSVAAATAEIQGQLVDHAKRLRRIESALNSRELCCIVEDLVLERVNSVAGHRYPSFGNFILAYRRNDADLVSIINRAPDQWLREIDYYATILEDHRIKGNHYAHTGRPKSVREALGALATEVSGAACKTAEAFAAWIEGQEREISDRVARKTQKAMAMEAEARDRHARIKKAKEASS